MSPPVSPTTKVSKLVPDDDLASKELPRASLQPPSPKPRDLTPAPERAAESPADNQPADLSDSEGIIDMETFLQILELDEEGDTHEFSRETIWAYFAQATETFEEMENAYAAEDLLTLSSLGHFLKGSSAALGLAKVQASCERIQHYGNHRDEEKKVDLSDKEALAKINTTLKRAKEEYAEAEAWLQRYYEGLNPKAAPTI